MTNRQISFTAITGMLLSISGAIFAVNGAISWSLAAVGLCLLALAGINISKRTNPALIRIKSEQS